MFGRNDWKDFLTLTTGQLFALFKHLGGAAGVKRVLSGLSALSATIPEHEVAETWMTVRVKTGYQVIASFYKAYGIPSSLKMWRQEIAASDHVEMEIDLCTVLASDLTGFDKPLPRSVFFSLIRHPYRILPAEILGQLPTVFDAAFAEKGWDRQLRMYAQPTVHDAAGKFNRVLSLEGNPPGSFESSWYMPYQERHAGAVLGPVVEDPKISPNDWLLVMKVSYPLVG
ncbi:MAG: hypothetical protein RLZZ70_697 [Candidatus Parcubacteria bacterium]|jgi:hypothetical protein